jgi:hypothetical protein
MKQVPASYPASPLFLRLSPLPRLASLKIGGLDCTSSVSRHVFYTNWTVSLRHTCSTEVWIHKNRSVNTTEVPTDHTPDLPTHTTCFSECRLSHNSATLWTKGRERAAVHIYLLSYGLHDTADSSDYIASNGKTFNEHNLNWHTIQRPLLSVPAFC